MARGLSDRGITANLSALLATLDTHVRSRYRKTLVSDDPGGTNASTRCSPRSPLAPAQQRRPTRAPQTHAPTTATPLPPDLVPQQRWGT
jgi:hypothetical protein